MFEEPRALVISSERKDDRLCTVLQLDLKRVQDVHPLAPASLVSLSDPNDTILILHAAIKQDQDQVTFVTLDAKSAPVSAGTHVFRRWWSAFQLELARSNSDRWRFEEYAVTEAGPISRGWTHEHCQICFKRISIFEGEDHDGYFDGKDWLCTSCFTEYVQSGFGKRLGDFFRPNDS